MGLESQAQRSRCSLVLQRALMRVNQVSNVLYGRLTSSTAAKGPLTNPTCLESIAPCCLREGKWSRSRESFERGLATAIEAVKPIAILGQYVVVCWTLQTI